MARTIAVIQQALIATLVAAGAAVGQIITPAEWSDYDYRQLITFTVATAQATLEQLWDQFRAAIELLIRSAAPQSRAWLQAQMLKFQYSATVPQVLQLNTTTFATYYPTVDTTLQVIKYCSVTSGSLGTVLIKCAAQAAEVPAPLSTPQKAAAQNYVDTIAVPGIYYVVRSLDSDKLYVAATIYYKGQYAAIIQDTVIAAIEAYLAGIPFDGQVLLSKLMDAIQAVPGVNDLVFNDVTARANATAYGSGTTLVAGNTTVLRQWDTIAGYIIGETDSGHTLADSLTFIAQS